jgi:hypothetical protein
MDRVARRARGANVPPDDKLLTPTAERAAASWAIEEKNYSQRRARPRRHACSSPLLTHRDR